ncbi:hypothetical protein [Bradyrhizobium arachidis]|nr:hypothetical protein [Bradyrhizobium arachidis]
MERPENGPDLGAILISAQFREILANAGMVIMPPSRDPAVRETLNPHLVL